jgi:hypothetical protein
MTKLLFQIVSIFIVSATMLLLNTDTYAKVPEWFTKFSKVVVMKSTRNEVEKLFDGYTIVYQKEFPREKNIEYKRNGDLLRVAYSTGKCSEAIGPPKTTQFGDITFSSNGYDVDNDVVISANYEPKKEQKFTTFKVDVSNYHYYKSDDTSNYFYENDELGIFYTLARNKLTNVRFGIPESKQSLSCK